MNEDLILGHSWESIQRAQMGGRLHDKVDISKPATAGATAADVATLSEHGEEWLAAQGMHGVIDRLRFSGLLK